MGRPRTGVLRDRPYLTLAALNAVLYLYMPMLSVLLPLYVVQRTTAPAWTVGGFFVLNTVGVTILQVRAARTVSDPRSAIRASRRAGLLLLATSLFTSLLLIGRFVYSDPVAAALAGIFTASIVLAWIVLPDSAGRRSRT